MVHLGVQPGDKLAVDIQLDGRIAIRKDPEKGSISQVFGLLKRPNGPSLTLEAINEIIAAGWAGELGASDQD